MTIDAILNAAGKRGLLDVIGGEEIILEAFRDIIRDELKQRIRDTIDADPALREEVHRAIKRYFEAKVLEAFAVLSLAKAGAKVGMEALPDELREKLQREVAATIERELAGVLQKTL